MSSSVGIILPNWMEKMFQTTNQAMISMVNFHFANGEVTVGIHRLCIQHTSTKVRRNYLEWNSKKSQQDMASLRIRDHQLILTIHLAVYHGLPAMGYIKWMPTLCWLVCNHKVHGLIAITNLAVPLWNQPPKVLQKRAKIRSASSGTHGIIVICGI